MAIAGAPGIELPTHPRAARMARDVVRRRAGGLLSSEALQDAVLLVSEVVTNALLHGAPPVTLQVSATPDRDGVRIVVSDCRAGEPTVFPADPSATGGRGMSVVAALAARWGVEQLPQGGKRVWFDVAARRRPGTAPSRPTGSTPAPAMVRPAQRPG